MEPRPYAPNTSEKARYYSGLAGNPQLIARTSSERWQSPSYRIGTFSGQHRKYLAGINQPDLVDKWTRPLCYRIIEVLKDCPWEYFFPIRVGIDTSEISNQIQQFDLSTVLMIGAPKEHLVWEQAVKFALDCRQVLREFHIEDIEVEIRDGGYQKQGVRDIEAQIDLGAAQYHETNHQALRLLPLAGFPIGYLNPRRGQGSMGLFLKLGNNPEVYGLTCRHVVNDERQPHESYRYSTGERQGHICGNADTYGDVCYNLEVHEENLKGEIEELATKDFRWNHWYNTLPTLPGEHLKPSDEELKNLERLKLKLLYHQKAFETIKTLENRSSRRIGTLAFHSKREISSRQKGYLKDWALIQMDSTQFEQDTKNRVVVGARLLEFMAKHHVKKSASFFQHYSNGVLTLRADSQNHRKPLEPFYVAKRGFKTGLTFGEVNGIEAVVRQRAGISDCFTWELIVIPEHAAIPFSETGDSGASVFDLEGRVIGIIVGSNRQNDPDLPWKRGVDTDGDGSKKIKMHPNENNGPEKAPETKDQLIKPWPDEADITFVSPIKWILDDIEEFTGQKPQVI